MSCGQIALRKLGVEPEIYYASEIDKHAIRQTQHNFPNTVQLGDVERWREWDIDWSRIDLVLAGSPCQGFSLAGKQLAFDDPRSRLFFVFIDILNHVRKFNPGVRFLLENVNMKRAHLRIISEQCGVFSVRINSALVSAQNRDRWYWTNVRTRQEGLFGDVYSDIPQPADKGIFLRDILEKEVPQRYYLSDKAVKYVTHKKRLGKYTELNETGEGKTMCLTANCDKSRAGTFIIQRPRGNNKGGDHYDKAPTLSANAWEQNNLVIQLNPSKESGGIQPYQQNRVYDPAGKSPALLAEMSCGSHAVAQSGTIRRLTPIECARLQTIPAWYEWVVSDTQIYKMLGNGWTVEVIRHILSFWDVIQQIKAA